jgi:ABC-type antimicrobial peptide transport system permease subunit
MFADNYGPFYRGVIRGYAEKIPGFTFTGFTAASGSSDTLVSIPDYNLLQSDYLTKALEAGSITQDEIDSWNAIVEENGFKNGIAKNTLFVKLNPDITHDERLFIANGIRNYFTTLGTVLFVKQDIVDTVSQVSQIFNIFVYIVGGISLALAFFLLLIATTANVTDAIWEYGVLRSMGVTRLQGIRIFMYEAYLVIVTASVLGTAVGYGLAALVAFQFYSFIELPPSTDFPWVLTLTMITIALVTTFVAVFWPIQQINMKQIARVLKAGS